MRVEGAKCSRPGSARRLRHPSKNLRARRAGGGCGCRSWERMKSTTLPTQMRAEARAARTHRRREGEERARRRRG